MRSRPAMVGVSPRVGHASLAACARPRGAHAPLVPQATDIARALADIAVLLELSGESAFKVRAFERGAQIIADLGQELAPLITEDQLTTIEGIGPSIARQVHELWNKGTSSLLARLGSAYPPGAVELARVPGMTSRRMRALYEGLGITSIDELRTACLSGRVRALRGFGPKSEQRLLEAVTRALAPEPPPPRRMLIAEALGAAERIERALLRSGVASAVSLTGPARRFEEVLDELALVITTEDEEAVWQRIPRLSDVTRANRRERRAQLRQGVPLTVHCTSSEHAGARLLFTTGPESHLQALVQRAHERGLELTPSGLRPLSAPGPEDALGDSEAALYRRLGLEPVPPELRRGPALPGDADSYADLLAPSDICGLVHCHTTYSDGKNSIEEMARAAEALGMHYLTITDHSPSAHYARGVTLDRLAQQWDEIAAVQERVNVRILRGTESDILADGSLDYPDAVLEQFDVVIASIHARFKLDRAGMTKRLLHAMSLPVFKIWGHALGRILTSRDPIDCDVPAVLDALARSRGAVELNADPHRLDLPPAWIPHARERGLSFVVSVDAHSTRGMNVLPLGVRMARRGGVRRGEVLNTLPVDAFLARVRPATAGHGSPARPPLDGP
jgi:DNA polymerase (family X)